MITYYILVIVAVAPMMSPDNWTPQTTCKNSQYILHKSQENHDPDNNWGVAEFSIHIQEPRLQNPQRYSILTLNNKTGAFSLVRDSEIGEIERIIDEAGNASVLLNGSSRIDEDLIQEYRLGTGRNAGYKSFYQLIYGLPMSVNEDMWVHIEDAKTISLEGQKVYQIRVELKEAMISKNWELFIQSEDYSLMALKFDHSDNPERPDEIIQFDGEVKLGGITIPRYRHWYLDESGEYRGSDIIIKEIKDS